MRKVLISMVLATGLLISCEEYYKPALDTVPDMIVIESHVTNDPNQNFVRLSMTRNFYNTDAIVKLSGALVELIQEGGIVIRADESGTGNYIFTVPPVSGKKYKLRVSYHGDFYESNVVVMPPVPSIDSLYTKHKILIDYKVDAFGVPQKIEIPGREICINTSITPELQYYRFNSREVLQWIYYPPPLAEPWFGWLSIYDNGAFNLAGPKEYTTGKEITAHPIFSLAYNGQQYLDSASQLQAGWIAIIDQYGISKESFDYHTKLNQQFNAEGNLFDPILTQVYGNMTCLNHPSKIAMGYFDLNSYRQTRYFLNIGSDDTSPGIVRKIDTDYNIPDNGYLIGEYPVFWENNY